MPGLDDLKNTVGGAVDAAKDKAEALTGIDINGDGAVAGGAGEASGGILEKAASLADAAVDKVEGITGIDIDGDGTVGSGEAAAEPIDTAPTPETLAAAAEIPESARGTFDQNEDLLTPVVEKASDMFDAAKTAVGGAVDNLTQGEGLGAVGAAVGGVVDKAAGIAGAAVDKVEDITGIDIDGDGTIGADAPGDSAADTVAE